jgi:hypothetical protein
MGSAFVLPGSYGFDLIAFSILLIRSTILQIVPRPYRFAAREKEM